MKIEKALKECLKRLYKQADPSADIDEIIRSGEGKMEGFFNGYYISEEDLEKIMKDIKKEFKLNKFEKNNLDFNVYLGSSPTSSRQRWEEERKTYDKKLKEHLKKWKKY